MRVLPLLLLAGCLPDLDLVHAWDDGTPTPPPPTLDTGPFDTAEPLPIDGQLVVDATSYEAWASIELDGIPHVSETEGWDLRVKRFEIELNGGVSGSEDVEVAFVAGSTLEELTETPAAPFVTDQPDGDDEDDLPDRAFDSWYDYDSDTHVLTPVPGVWIVRTSEGAYTALAIEDYYDDVGTSGVMTWSWKRLDAE